MYDIAIIGCGVVGAATAYALSRYNVRAVVLEAENDVACGTTKANSAILHAGYDPEPGTLMARMNVRGSAMAKDICAALDVPYSPIGSLVLAFSDDELAHLQKLYENGMANGVPGVRLLHAQEALALEPQLSPSVKGALLAPSAAVVSPWDFALAMAETAVKNGVDLRLDTRVTAIDTNPDDTYTLHTKNMASAQTEQIQAAYIVNAAGIHCADVHNMVAAPAFTVTPGRGEYYLLDKNEGARVNHVVFQCPGKAGKGVLVAPTVHGNLIVGPNAENADTTATTADGLAFVAATAKKSVPDVDLRASIRNFAGLRANTNRDDFIVEFGAPRFLDLAGIKSPGLSAAPALGEEAVRLLAEAGLNLTPKETFDNTRRRAHFHDLSLAEKQALVLREPAFGRVICRCETITEGEILSALQGPIPPRSIDAVKRRTGAGMGRCQGGFCGPRVLEILARAQHRDPLSIEQDTAGTRILTGHTKAVQDAQAGDVQRSIYKGGGQV